MQSNIAKCGSLLPLPYGEWRFNWRHDMETLSTLLALCGVGNHSPLDFLKGLVMQGYDVLLWTWAGHRADCRVADDIQYKGPRILTLKCFFSRLDVAFAQSNETRYQVENEDAVGTAPTGDLSDQQFYCLLSCDLY